jgi:hypothetical protein
VSHRFEIEDLFSQDDSGVVFHARDTETEESVALRRFFPFGVTGGGLSADEQIAYQAAVERLATVRHPALRRVIGGGCDPIDGMPFVASEWVEGVKLQSHIDRAPFTPVEAVRLLSLALEVCQILSEVHGEEAVWVELDLRSIIVAEEGLGRGVTFWIAPLKALGKSDRQRGLTPFITLTEEIMGWGERAVPDQAGGGLGGWVKWLRTAGRMAKIGEAKEMLAAALRVKPQAPTMPHVRLPIRGIPPRKRGKKSSHLPVFFTVGGFLLTLGLAGWFVWQRHESIVKKVALAVPQPPLVVVTPPVILVSETQVIEPPAVVLDPQGLPPQIQSEQERSPEQASLVAVEMTANLRQMMAEKDAKAAHLLQEITRRGGVFAPADYDLLVTQRGKQVTVEGVLTGFTYSANKKTLYLTFSQYPTAQEARGSIKLRTAGEDLKEPALKPMLGKKIRITGKFSLESFTRRPVITLKNRSAIQEMK